MKKIFAVFLISMFLIVIFFSGCVNQSKPEIQNNQENESIEIAVENNDSPIRKYFTTPKILWTFDDYMIPYHHHPPHKGFGGLTEQVNSYGGFVQIMAIFTSETYTKPFGNQFRNYSVIDDFGYSQIDVAKSIEFFSRPMVTVGAHGFNHTQNLNYINLNLAFNIINYTMWNWKNNYGIIPHFFLGPSTSGNYNLTVAMKQFSEIYWPVYGENFRWYDAKLFPHATRNAPAVDYIEKPSYTVEFDPLFGASWGTPCKNLQEAKNLFNSSSAGKEILLVRGHPSFLNGTDTRSIENLSYWEQWIDWIYQNHDLVNINHSTAIKYNIDRYHFKVIKNSEEKYTINLMNCSFNHSVLFSKPLNNTKNWAVYDQNNRLIGNVQDDTFIQLNPGTFYFFRVT